MVLPAQKYVRRSKLVHTGDARGVTKEDVLQLRHLVREAIKEIHRADKSKDELLQTLDESGFGSEGQVGAK